MTLHREGKGLLVGIAVALLIINLGAATLLGQTTALAIVHGLSVVLYLLVINFFRYEKRVHPQGKRADVVVCPADGKVVVIEEVEEAQVLGERCLQVSIFMNVFDMHVNWIPVNGIVEHVSHKSGRFMAAHLPKSSTDNERADTLIRTVEGHRVLVRQIAGAVAQRIVTYTQEGSPCQINENLGFIKFGSRVDLYLPLGTKVHTRLGERVKGNVTLIAELPRWSGGNE